MIQFWRFPIVYLIAPLSGLIAGFVVGLLRAPGKLTFVFGAACAAFFFMFCIVTGGVRAATMHMSGISIGLVTFPIFVVTEVIGVAVGSAFTPKRRRRGRGA